MKAWSTSSNDFVAATLGTIGAPCPGAGSLAQPASSAIPTNGATNPNFMLFTLFGNSLTKPFPTPDFGHDEVRRTSPDKVFLMDRLLIRNPIDVFREWLAEAEASEPN